MHKEKYNLHSHIKNRISLSRYRLVELFHRQSVISEKRYSANMSSGFF